MQTVKYLVVLVVTAYLVTTCHAQIITDGTVGPTIELTGENVTIDVDLGKRAGNNLFHSFQDFNINTGQSATFTGDAAIERVISRVTGGNISNIDGLLKSEILNADFFLVNPAGVMFGPNATIDTNGSFSVSTADYLRLGENDQFFSQPIENEVFSIEPPTAYGFLAADIGTITFDQSQIGVNEGETMSVIGGGIDASASHLEAPAGAIDIVSVDSEGEAQITSSESGLIEFDIESFTDLGDIHFNLETEINVDGEGSGAVIIRGENMTLDESSIIATTTGSTSGKNIDITLTGSLNLLRGATILSSTESTGDGGNIIISANSSSMDSLGVGLTRIRTQTMLLDGGSKGGDIIVNTTGLQVVNGGQISTTTRGSGNGGTLTITAETVFIDGQNSQLFTGIAAQTMLADGGGKGGDITINTMELEVVNGGAINATTVGSGDGGTLTVTANNVLVDRQNSPFTTGIDASTHLEASGGKGGDITINTMELEVVNGGQIGATTRGSGDGGTLTITSETVFVDGQNSQLFTGIAAETHLDVGGGKGGDIIINTTNLQVANVGHISAGTFGSGDGGTLTITAETVFVDGQNSQLFTGIAAETHLDVGGGKGGNVTINTTKLELLNGGAISTSTFGNGDGGTLTVNANDLEVVNGGTISTSTFGNGDGDTLTVNANDLEVVNGGVISTSTFGSGDGGILTVTAETVFVDGQNSQFFTGIAAETRLESGGGKGGNVIINTTELAVVSGGAISTTTRGSGDGGTLIFTAETVFVDGQDLRLFTGIGAQTVFKNDGGKGGNVIIDTTELKVVNGGSISTTTFGSGDGGTLTVTAEAVFVDGQNSQSITGIGAGTTMLDDGGGRSGDIIINTTDLQMVNGGAISATTFGSGDGGNIDLRVNSMLIGGEAFVSTEAEVSSQGQAGDISIEADEFVELNNGFINTQAAQSNGGEIQIKAGSDINLLKSQISAEAGLNGGNININSGSALQLTDSRITAEAGSNGGNITLNNNLTILADSRLTASAEFGNGGNIFIDTNGFFANVRGLFVEPEEVIDVSSEFGVSGTVEIARPDINLTAGLVPLAEEFLDVESWALTKCSTKYERGDVGTFHVIHREGTSLPPDDLLPSFSTSLEKEKE